MQPSDMQAIAADFNRATQAHGAGRIADAEAIYRDVLRRAPGHVGALHLIGVCHFQRGSFVEGIPWVEKALALKPDFADAHNNLANAFKALGRLEDALASYDRALAAQPGYAAAHYNRANALAMLRRFDDALASYDRVLALAANNADAHNNRGIVLQELGRLDEALAAFARAIELRPDLASAHYNQGNALAAADQPLAALASYDRALAFVPDYVSALNNRGNVLETLQRPNEALASYDRALAVNPRWAEALSNRANVLRDFHRFDEALRSYDEALTVRPDYPEAVFNRSIMHLLRGDFAAGWNDYEERWRYPKFIANSAGHLTSDVIARLTVRPERAALAGKRCLVVGEQGLGDHVMFASLLGDLMRDAAQVTCLVDRKLAGLLQRSLPGLHVGDLAQIQPAALDGMERVLGLGSLAFAYRRTAADFPGTPYLTPDPEKVAAWRRRLGRGDGRPLVGVSWRGGTAVSNAASRSMTLETLLPALEVSAARFVSLQYGDVAEEVAAFNARHGQDMLCLPREEIENFDDLAALICALDGVLSVQTALIHLCGALGRDCLTLVPRQPEWRYGLTGDRMPWYRSVRLVRQGADGDWAPVVARAAALLHERLGGSQP